MSTFNVNELDFFRIKDNIITFLKSQDEFQDYNFEGSGMDVLMNLLAYSTHYMGVYNNMTFNEMFLQTGLLRASVVSKATELNYIPKQETAARASINLNLTIPDPKPSNVFVPQGTRFSAVNEVNQTFNFITDKDYFMEEEGTSGVFSAEMTILEGTFIEENFVHDINNPIPFELSNDNVDMQFTEVNIADFQGSTNIAPWLNYQNIVNIQSDTQAYFYRENVQGKTELYFGDGVIGRSLEDGNVVNVKYLITNGSEANNISTFSLVNSIAGYQISAFTIDTLHHSIEGKEKESIESIKHNAPLFYQTQNRSTVEEDYIRLLNAYHGGNIEAINVWGGETNDPPLYGRVLISIKPTAGTQISSITQEAMLETLNRFSVVGIIPEFINPTYTYVNLNITAKYQDYLTTKSEEQLKLLISEAIDNHFVEELYLFDATFKYSTVLCLIDNVDPSIYNNFIDLTLHQEFVPSINTVLTYDITFNNAIKPSSVLLEWTNLAGESMRISDNGEGLLLQYRDGVMLEQSAGSVDYIIGKITLDNYNPNLPNIQTLEVFVVPQNPDIFTVNNNILLKGTVTTTLSTVQV